MAYRFLRFPNGKSKAVTLSYDDGSSFDQTMVDILNRYGIKCTLNLNSFRLNTEGALTVAQIEKMLEQGHEVAVHGANHYASGLVRPAEGIRDVLHCREALETTFGRIIRGMAYADSGINRFIDGNNYETVRNYLNQLGIVYSRTLGKDNDSFELPTDWYAWMPTAHHASPNLMELIDKFLALDNNTGYTAMRYPRLFYLWGHGYEFHYSNNWDLLESICAKLSGKDDIWYATNIEIYDYVMAYQSLHWSADSKRVYNPTLFTLWFSIDDSMYTIAPGETLVIE